MRALRRTTTEERLLTLRQLQPAAFEYPERYFRTVAGDELPAVEPWAWLCEYEDDLEFWADVVAKQYSTRSLVPFAKRQDTDDVFCFEGTDTSGNPPVLIIHTFASPGWEYRGQWKDFDVWWSEMEDQHRNWLAEHEDEERPDGTP